MKKLIFTLVTLLICFGASTTAYAGSINSCEQEILNAAEQTYTYDGVEYKLTDSAISQIRGYLSQDGIDLTEAKKSEALASVNSYIKQGIDGGYLVPVNGQPGGQDSSGSNNSSSAPTGNPASGSSGTDSSSASQTAGTDNSSKGNSGSSGVSSAADSSGYQYPSDLSKYIGNIGNISDSFYDTAQKKNQAESDENFDEFIDGLFSGKNEYNTSDEIAADHSDISDEEYNRMVYPSDTEGKYTEDTVIKDTGFNLNLTFAVAALMGVVMLAGIIVTIRFNYFAQSKE